ncbi:MAG: DUF349 domain-containing protein [Cyclobacteriaceae bacterium]|nr:DUF349 domain-containing protein [Cyclobacteriaceae bacterium HetDA_MAG_MS6]
MSHKEIPYGYVKADKIYLKSWNDHQEREVGTVRNEDVDASVEYFVKKFQELTEKSQELEEKIEKAENKGSFLMKLVHLREGLASHDGLGDYKTLDNKLSILQKQLEEIIHQNRLRNLEIKKALLVELGEAVELFNWKESTEKVHDIKERWLKTGNATPEENGQLEEVFWTKHQSFFDRKKAFYEDKKRLMANRQREYEQIISEASILRTLKGKAYFDKVKELKARWQENGNIPADIYNGLHRAFYALLKPQRSFRPPIANPEAVLDTLKAIESGQKPFDKREVDELRKTLKSIRSYDPAIKQKRKEAMSLLQFLMEKDFVEKICQKRNPDFRQLPEEQQIKLRIKITKELLIRDQSELDKYLSNADQYSTRSGEMAQMMERKIQQQRNKVQVKKTLIEIMEKAI